MQIVGKQEIDAVARLVRSGRLFRYHKDGECERFERRYAKYLGVKYVCMTSSGTTAITAALGGLGIGPGDEVIVPAHTYMATAVSVLAAGAIPVLADVDESITLDPDALEDAIGRRTRAVVPVHLWGMPCDMDRIMKIARRRKLMVVEDVAQAVGGGYRGRMLGSIGHAGAFSFNFYKNMTCGEGGAVVTSNRAAMDRARCMVDCTSFYWKGRKKAFPIFACNSARASELEGAIMNAQLDRIRGIIRTVRGQKKKILRETTRTGLRPIRANSLNDECGTNVGYIFPKPGQARSFVGVAGGTVASRTGRHNFTEWDPVLAKQGAHHPALNPFTMPQNRRCRKQYSKQKFRRSLDILDRIVLIPTNIRHKVSDVNRLIRSIKKAAAEVL